MTHQVQVQLGVILGPIRKIRSRLQFYSYMTHQFQVRLASYNTRMHLQALYAIGLWHYLHHSMSLGSVLQKQLQAQMKHWIIILLCACLDSWKQVACPHIQFTYKTLDEIKLDLYLCTSLISPNYKNLAIFLWALAEISLSFMLIHSTSYPFIKWLRHLYPTLDQGQSDLTWPHLNSFVSSRGSVLHNIMMHSCMFQPLIVSG